MANNIWSNYTEKIATPVDADEVMVRDSTDGKNKRLLFGTFWKWVAKKLNEATISELQTNNKTIIGAINALNGKPGTSKITGINTASSGNRIWISVNGDDGQYAMAVQNEKLILYKSAKGDWSSIATIGDIKTWADNTTIDGNWCSFIEFGNVVIGVAYYSPTLYFRLFNSNKWFYIKGTAQES